MVSPYRRFRADGWPYCPCCDEDELYSLADPASIETIVGCYRCGWRPVRAGRRGEVYLEGKLIAFTGHAPLTAEQRERLDSAGRD